MPCVQPANAPPYGTPPPRPRRKRPYGAAYTGYAAERPLAAEHARVPVEIAPTAGYSFSTGIPVTGGVLAFAPSPVFGATVNVGDWYGLQFQVAYMLQWAGLELESNSGETTPQYTVTAHHFQVGGEWDILRGRVRPFLGLMLGAVWFAPQADVPDELWFEGSVQAGAKVRITKTLGIRAQAQFTGITMDARSEVFCANGCNTSWYGIGMSTLALTAGPTLRF